MPSSGVQTCADRKSTRLNSSHGSISYAVFCLKKKEYLNRPDNFYYYPVEDFRWRSLPDDYFNYMFSFGTLCHLQFWMIVFFTKTPTAEIQPLSNRFSFPS